MAIERIAVLFLVFSPYLSAEDRCCPPLQKEVIIDNEAVYIVTISENAIFSGSQLCARIDLSDEVCGLLLSHLDHDWKEHCIQSTKEERVDPFLQVPRSYFFSSFSPKDTRQEPSMKPPTTVPVWLPPSSHDMMSTLAQSVTRVWMSRGISRSEIETAADKENDCILFQVINGTAYAVLDSSKDWKHTKFPWRARRRLAVFQLLQDLAPTIDADLEIVFCPTDCVQSSTPIKNTNKSFFAYHGAGTYDLPILSLVGCRNSLAIPFPVFDVRTDDMNESLVNWDNVARRLVHNRNSYSPWKVRNDRAIFRGQIHGKSCWPGSLNTGIGPHPRSLDIHGLPLCGRRRLFSQAAQWPSRFDIGFDNIPLLHQELYKYQIYAEGHCGWSDRLKYLLFMGTALFMQETFCREFYAFNLTPWVHYVPLAYNFNNLAALHAWVQMHPLATQRIIENMHTYAQIVLNEQAIRLYAFKVLNHLATALKYRPRLRPQASTELSV